MIFFMPAWFFWILMIFMALSQVGLIIFLIILFNDFKYFCSMINLDVGDNIKDNNN